jgi:hypothetical protein
MVMINVLMMIYLLLFISIGVCQSAWVRVWEDNFDWNGGVDLNKWEFDEGGHGWGLSTSTISRSTNVDRIVVL